MAAASSIEIRAAGNEFELFQVVATARSPLNSVTVTASALTLDGSTIVIPASEVRVYREQKVRLREKEPGRLRRGPRAEHRQRGDTLMGTPDLPP